MHIASILVPDFADQETRFSSAFSILTQAIEQRAFPAASVAVTRDGKLVALKALGHFIYSEDGDPDMGDAPCLAAVARHGSSWCMKREGTTSEPEKDVEVLLYREGHEFHSCR